MRACRPWGHFSTRISGCLVPGARVSTAVPVRSWFCAAAAAVLLSIGAFAIVPQSASAAVCEGDRPHSRAIWTACLTIGKDSSLERYGYDGTTGSEYGSLSDTEFTIFGRSYRIDSLKFIPGTGLQLDVEASTSALSGSNLALQVGTTSNMLGSRQDPYTWSSPRFTWNDANVGEKVSVSLRLGSPADDISPEVRSAAVTGKNLALTFSEHLNQDNIPPTDRFTVRVNGERREVAGVSIDHAAFTLTLAEATVMGETVTVSYDPPRLTAIDRYRGRSAPALQDLSGNQVASFTNLAVTNNSAACPGAARQGSPFWSGCLTVGEYGGNYLVGFRGVGTPFGKLSGASFTHSSVGYRIDAIVERSPFGSRSPRVFIVSFADDPRPAAKNWTLQFGDSFALKFKDAQYRENGHHYEWTLSGSKLGLDRLGDAVTVFLGEGSDTPPKLSDQPVVEGNTLKLTFDEDLNTGSVPAKAAFDVEVAGSDRALASANPVAVSGKTVTLTLASAAGWREKVTVSYTKPASNPLEDGAGNDVVNFDMKVVNETPNPRERGLVFAPASVTVEEGGSATYTVKLDRAPEAGYPVYVSVREIKTHYLQSDKLRISPGGVLLNTTNWNTGEEFTVSALRDGDGHDNRVTLKHGGVRVRGGYTEALSGSAHVKVTMTDTNAPPRVANPIPSQALIAGQSFSYAFPEDTFYDADGDELRYSAGRFISHHVEPRWPSWLEFDSSTRTFSGTPQRADTGFYRISVVANDGVRHRTASTQNTFLIRVYESLEAQLEGQRLRPAPSGSWSRSLLRSAEGPPGVCRVEVSVRFVAPDGTAVYVAELTADDFAVQNGRLGTPVRDGEGWRVPVSPDPGFTGLMRVRLLARELSEIPEPDSEDDEVDLSQVASQAWPDSEQVFHVASDTDCAPAARNELASLSLDGLDLDPAFDAGTTAYAAAAPADGETVTVTAAAVYGASEVTVLPADADTGAEGHQVALAEGETGVTVTVTPADGSGAQTYTVTVTRGSAAANAGVLTGFVLVDASTDADLGTVESGGTVSVSADGSYGVRAGIEENAEVGSVVLSLVGPGAEDTHTQTENIAPYSLYGDAQGAEHGRALPAGSYTLTATAYAERGGAGEALGTLTVPFTVAFEAPPPPPAGVLTGLVLLDASDQSTVATLSNGAAVDLGGRSGGSFAIRADVASNATVGSVALSLAGAKTVSATENHAPWSLYGDRRDGNGGRALDGASLPAGSYTLTATAYAERGASGAVLGSLSVSFQVLAPAALTVADAQAGEGPGATLDFAVTLDRSSTGTVTVAYATSDGTATAGSDYTAVSGTLTFAAGETEKTVSVPVLEDDHNEGSETLTLRLASPSGATIDDGEATGTITNSDAIPEAWLARFGRTVTGQVLDAVEQRLTGPRQAGVRASLAGQALPSWTPGSGLRSGAGGGTAAARSGSGSGTNPGAGSGTRPPGSGSGAGPGAGDNAGPERLSVADSRSRDAMETVRNWMADADAGRSDAGGLRSGVLGGDNRSGFRSRALTPRDFLTGTSFALTAKAGGGRGAGYASLWGRGAIAGFDGREGDLSLDGEVTTGLIGADWASDPGSGSGAGSGRWVAGLAIGHSTGTGGWRRGGECDPNCGGRIEATLTGLYPYAGMDLTERLSVWAAAGYGAGEVTVTPDGGPGLTADLTMAMGAAGLRSNVLRPEDGDGFSLDLKGDARFTRTASDAVRSASGNLEAAEADVWLIRAGVEGSRRFALGNGTDGGVSLTPSFEAGLRLDGGDAESGFGADLGGGLAFADPASGLRLDLKGRVLIAHSSAGFKEWGASGALAWDPRPETDRGLSLSLRQSWGAAPAGGMDALLSRETLAGLAANNNPGSGAGAGGRFEASSRLEAEIGYGLATFGGAFTGTPNIGFGLSGGGGRDWRIGWRLTSAVSGDPGFEVNLDANRHEPANDEEPEHAVMLRGAIRF